MLAGEILQTHAFPMEKHIQIDARNATFYDFCNASAICNHFLFAFYYNSVGKHNIIMFFLPL